MKLLTVLLIFLLLSLPTRKVFGTDRGSVEEFKIREKSLSDKYDNFYVRQKEIKKKIKEREAHSREQAEHRFQMAEIRDRNRRNYKRPVKISDEEGERLYKEIQQKRSSKKKRLQSFYVTKKIRENGLREGLKKIPGNHEFNLSNYDEIPWLKEKAQKKRGR
ncbi:hypothetical protein OAQ84_00630 [Bdellovibrionales bacterium]|nr:hypothetical protein [Bdellovibrionales bacterium]